MLFRNLVSMDVEESIRANPIDGVALLAGVTKLLRGTLDGRSQLQPAGHHGLGGPMLNGKFRGQDIGSGQTVAVSEDACCGAMSECDFQRKTA
jgi:dihydroxyacid dehydratase/phosphogluconate dehydratase